MDQTPAQEHMTFDQLRGFSEGFFPKKDLSTAEKLVELGRVSLSFFKGDFEGTVIASGIVKDNASYQSKVVYKKRLEDSTEGPLKTFCDCPVWNNEDHCAHAASIFISAVLQEGHKVELFDSNGPSMHHMSGRGVTPFEYSTMIRSPHKLDGAHPGATYSTLQYQLDGGKIVPFPIPKPFEGKVVINYEDSDKIRPTFEYLDEHKQINRKVSMFENLYLFDWVSGEAYSIRRESKEFFHWLKIEACDVPLEEILQSPLYHKLSKYIEIKIDGVLIEDIPRRELQSKLVLANSSRQGLIDLVLTFHDHDDRRHPGPPLFQHFTFTNGWLSDFRTKKEAYSFVSLVKQYFEDHDENFKRKIAGNPRKSTWLTMIESIHLLPESIHYDKGKKELVTFSNHTAKKLFDSLFENFGENLFRFAANETEEQEVRYKLSKSNLFDGLWNFHRQCQLNGITLFYDRRQISQWSSRVRFERKRGMTQWFDLELTLSDLDLEIIKKADIERGIVETEEGLTLLTEDQKALVKYLKKYTAYEAKESIETGVEGENKFLLPFNRARLFELFELRKLGLDGALTPDEIEICEKLENLEEIPAYPLPPEFDGVLRPYQKVGYDWIRFLHEMKLGACLADDMGLGKTIQSIAFIQSIYDKVDRILIACPVTLLLNWENEFKKFSQLDIAIYHGGGRVFPKDQKIVLTSYGVMKREYDKSFKEVKFDILIMDEVQHLKNIRSLGAYAARNINADFKMCLTGTPVENDLAEFYNILDLCVPGLWGDIQFVRSAASKKSRLLARKVAAPYILRRTKAQVLTDLPPKIENNVFLNLSDEEKKKYDNRHEDIRRRILTSTNKRKYGEILKGLLELRQSCLWQGQVDKTIDLSRNLSQEILSTKVDFLIEQLEQIIEEGHQAIIFSQFTTYLDIMESFIREKHWKMSRIDGSMSAKRRQEQVDLFQAGKNPVFLISLRAGGVGLNLTAASYVFVMDPWWNPAVEAQAVDRAHRIGQKNALTVYRPIIKGSVEEKVLQLQEYKKQLFLDLLPTSSDEQLFSGKLTQEDFEFLLS